MLSDIDRYLGAPWVRGAEGPDTFDCWGWVKYCLNKIGYGHTLDIDYRFPNGLDGEFIQARKNNHWVQVDSRSDNAIVFCYRGEVATHIGIMVEGMFSHAIGNKDRFGNEIGSVQLTQLPAIKRMFTKLEFLQWQN